MPLHSAQAGGLEPSLGMHLLFLSFAVTSPDHHHLVVLSFILLGWLWEDFPAQLCSDI